MTSTASSNISNNYIQKLALFNSTFNLNHKQYYNQHMSNNKTDPIIKYLTIAGGLAVAYFTLNYFSSPNLASRSTTLITLERTRRILQEIKYQMYANCISFSEGVKTKLKAKFAEQQLEKYLRTQMAKLYEQKEELIISKYVITKQDLAAALLKHKNDREIIKNQNEILDMMNRAIQGEIPDLTVHEDALKLLNLDQIRSAYREVCELIGVKVWQKLEEKKNKDPTFNCKDDADYKKAIRELSIYDLKIGFLREKGFLQTWGCPNEVFFKVMEIKKNQNPEFKVLVTAIQKAYQKVIEIVSHSPETMSKQRIFSLMQESISGVKGKPQIPVAQKRGPPAPKVAQPLISSVSKKAVRPVEEEFDLDKLMMQELHQRSQEVVQVKQAPKPTQKEEEFDLEKLMLQELHQRSQEVVEAKPDAPSEDKPVVVIQAQIEIKTEIVAVAAEVSSESVPVEIKPEVVDAPVEIEPEVVVVFDSTSVEVVVEGQTKNQVLVNEADIEIVREEPRVEASVQISLQDSVEKPLPAAQVLEEVIAVQNEETKPQLPEQTQHSVQKVQIEAIQQQQATIVVPAQPIIAQVVLSEPSVDISEVKGEIEIEVTSELREEKLVDIAASQEPEVLQNNQSEDKKEPAVVPSPSESLEEVMAPSQPQN